MSRGRSLALLALQAALLVGYGAAFGLFVTQSDDFIVERNNSRAIAAARGEPALVAAEYSFGPTGGDNALLGAGWHRILEQDAGAWTKSLGHVFLPVPSNGGDMTIEIDGAAYLAPGHEAVVVVLFLDGRESGRWIARHGEPGPQLTARVPAEVVRDGLIELGLDASPGAVPYHFDRSDDKRKIGFLLRAVRMASDQGAP